MSDPNRRDVIRAAAAVGLASANFASVLAHQPDNAVGGIATTTTRLSPDTIAKYDYYFQCSIVKLDEHTRMNSSEAVTIDLRFAPKRRRGWGVRAEDLKAIESVSLVVRDGNRVQLIVPLHTEIDPGNYIHLHSRLSVQRDLLRELQLKFDERGEDGKRTFVANLNDFIDPK